MQNAHFGSKIKIPKNMWKFILQIIYSCSVQKTAQKNTKYSRNESILKIGHYACKGYSPCKIITLAQKLKFQKTCQSPFYKSFTVVLCKKPLQKTTLPSPTLQKTGTMWPVNSKRPRRIAFFPIDVKFGTMRDYIFSQSLAEFHRADANI